MSTSSRIIYTNDTGNLCVIRPTQEWFDLGYTIEQLADKDVPKGVEYVILDSENKIPDDRYFRGAWTLGESTVEIDLIKARKIKLGNLREVRNIKLAELDKDVIVAVGKNDKDNIASIEAEKQQLRDMPITATAELAEIEDLELIKNYTPFVTE